MPIKITGIRNAFDAPVGDNRLLAYFDVLLEGIIELRGCVLVQGKHGLEIWSPPCNRKANEPERAIRFVSSMRRAITKAARDAYEAFMRDQAAPRPATSAMIALVREIEERDAA